MDRQPGDIEMDPALRMRYVEQESLDEFCLRIASEAFPDDPIRQTDLAQRQDFIEAARPAWREGLDPDTNIEEILYLQGLVDPSSRIAVIDQVHAAFRNAWKDVLGR